MSEIEIEAHVIGGWRPTPPAGRTSQRWYARGYRAALKDLEEKFAQGGEVAAREWIKNNLAP